MNYIKSFLSHLRRKILTWYYTKKLLQYEDRRTISLGVKGEDYATAYVLSKGYIIAGRNWRDGRNELDLIAWDDCTLVFIEVKTRTDEDFEPPERNVNREKQRRIVHAANSYYQLNAPTLQGAPVRFDVIALIWPADAICPSITRHWENAFR